MKVSISGFGVRLLSLFLCLGLSGVVLAGDSDKSEQDIEFFLYEHNDKVFLNLIHDLDGAIEFDRALMAPPILHHLCDVLNTDGTKPPGSEAMVFAHFLPDWTWDGNAHRVRLYSQEVFGARFALGTYALVKHINLDKGNYSIQCKISKFHASRFKKFKAFNGEMLLDDTYIFPEEIISNKLIFHNPSFAGARKIRDE